MRIPIAYGRDATDVAISTSFGPSTLTKFVVWTDEVNESERLPQHLRRYLAA